MNLDLVKTLTFAMLHFSVGFGVTYCLTGSVAISTGVALIEPAVNTVVFFFHEKAWRHFGSHLGRHRGDVLRHLSAAATPAAPC